MALLDSLRVGLGAAVLATSLLWVPIADAQPPHPGEAAVKAAFLYHFTKYVEWPPSAFSDSRAPFRVCVFVTAPFRRDIEAMLAGEAVGGRPVRVISPEPADARSCHLAYFGPGGAERSSQLLATLRQAPVLTVGEGQRFLDQGGQISFVLDENRVRFDVNKRAVDRAGLTVSSKLLRVARHVESGGPSQ